MAHSITSCRRLPQTSWTNLENLVHQFLGSDGGNLVGEKTFYPPTNIVESEQGFEVTLELAGIDPADVNVELNDGQLIISGEKKNEFEEEGKTFHRIERRHGEFRRSLTLPTEVEQEKIDAAFKNGLLTVSLPKSEKVLPKQIEVKTSE